MAGISFKFDLEIVNELSIRPYIIYRFLLSATLLTFLAGQAHAQQKVPDTLQSPKTDTLKPLSTVIAADTTLHAKPKLFEPNPKKSGLYSALIPGMGQIYNRQYWKVPIIYAGFSIAGYYIVQNLDTYQEYRQAYIGRYKPNPTDKYLNIYTQDQLKLLQDAYEANLNQVVLFTSLGYFLQVIDAIVYAHLKNFDMSRNLSMHISPVANPNGLGIGLVINY